MNVVDSRAFLPPPFTCDEFNRYLLSISPGTAHLNLYTQNPEAVRADFVFQRVPEEVVLNAIHSVKSEAIGLSFIKLLLPVISGIVTSLFNKVLASSTFPSAWKNAMVLPVAKKCRSQSCSEYRPISILPALSKALETVIKNQIMEHVTANSLLFDFQSAYRDFHDTSTALLHVTQWVHQAFERQEIVLLVLLDFSKAFDSVSHSLLCSKLGRRFGFSECAVSLIESYLSHRHQSVWINGTSSTALPVISGVPQGSVLGPILFSLFVNDLPSVLRKTQCHMYADDVQLFASRNRNDALALIHDVNNDLKAVSEWARANNLTLNASKTQVMMLSISGDFDTSGLFVVLGNSRVSFSDSVKDLGLTITKDLSWNENANNTSAKVFAGLRSLWPHQRNLPLMSRVNLVKTLLMPLFCYGSVVFSKLSASAEATLLRAFNGCIRFVAGLRRFDSTSQHRNIILGCGLLDYLDYKSCLFMFKLLQSGKPGYLVTHIQRGTSNRTANLLIPRHRTASTGVSFFVNGVSKWNSLPLTVKRQDTVRSFKSVCRDHFNIT